MTSLLSPTNNASTALPGPSVELQGGLSLCTEAHSGMTPAQQLQDEILGLTAKLEGKLLELAFAQGERDLAQKHLEAMNKAIRAHRDFRIAVEAGEGGCYFDAAGVVDRSQIVGQVAQL